jgi:hypothetical protein
MDWPYRRSNSPPTPPERFRLGLAEQINASASRSRTSPTEAVQVVIDYFSERSRSAARDQGIIHTARFYRESAALRCSATAADNE